MAQNAGLPLATVLAASLGAGGLIVHLDRHIQKVLDACPGLAPALNDPQHEPVKKWLVEFRTALANLRRHKRNAPKNKARRKPVKPAAFPEDEGQRGSRTMIRRGEPRLAGRT